MGVWSSLRQRMVPVRLEWKTGTIAHYYQGVDASRVGDGSMHEGRNGPVGSIGQYGYSCDHQQRHQPQQRGNAPGAVLNFYSSKISAGDLGSAHTGSSNTLADALSRNNLPLFFYLFPHAGTPTSDTTPSSPSGLATRNTSGLDRGQGCGTVFFRRTS